MVFGNLERGLCRITRLDSMSVGGRKIQVILKRKVLTLKIYWKAVTCNITERSIC